MSAADVLKFRRIMRSRPTATLDDAQDADRIMSLGRNRVDEAVLRKQLERASYKTRRLAAPGLRESGYQDVITEHGSIIPLQGEA